MIQCLSLNFTTLFLVIKMILKNIYIYHNTSKKSLSPFAHKHQKCMQCIKIFLGFFFSLDMKNTTIIYKSLILLLLLKAIRLFHKFHFIAFLSSNLSGDGGIIRSRGGPPRIDKSWL